ncbi:fad binding protein [Rhizoctonia solani]|uniref:Fad binding protein n=1 Tax=Rhizoctonia solani TaxID=456999 RepID=A0A8H7M192_9AGAM|nr:fad binding protein [Rhizoctonia solani]
MSSRSVLTPSCILVPESSSDVAKALKILVKNNCEFAVRGGGHTANPGWAGTTLGTHILVQVHRYQGQQRRKVGDRRSWKQVGRCVHRDREVWCNCRRRACLLVGVSGFLLGGGLSFLMHSEGFAANSVLSYESQQISRDLFKALKGGTGNFGIATSFTLQAYAIKDVYAGNLYYTPDKYDMLFPIMEQFARTGIESDPKTHMISTFISAPSQLLQLAAFYTFYSEPVTAPPPAIQPFFNVPTTVNTVGVKTVKQAADELGTGNVNGLSNWLIAVIQLRPSWARRPDGARPSSFTYIQQYDPIVSYQFTWELPQDDEKAYAAANRIIAESMDIAKSQNRLGQYVYLNYASTNQKPIESYGSEQVEFLQKVKAKYDPHRGSCHERRRGHLIATRVEPDTDHDRSPSPDYQGSLDKSFTLVTGYFFQAKPHDRWTLRQTLITLIGNSRIVRVYYFSFGWPLLFARVVGENQVVSFSLSDSYTMTPLARRLFGLASLVSGARAYGAPATCPERCLQLHSCPASTCVLKPACIFTPELSSDLSIALKILVEDDCEFAIRGGGHTPNPGWASTDSGVLISLSGLTAIQVSQDKQSVVIGAGNRWGDVYAKIGEYDVTVTGGRISPVGVSGFLLGGGLSYLMHSEGFSANNILSYEIVLANGTISTVTAESAGDLFRALKGGTGNFGLVTSFTLQTYPISQVYAGNLYYSPDNYDALFPLMEEYARKGVESDPKSHVISAFVYFPSQAIDMATFYSFYSEPVTAPPEAIKPFFGVPTVINTVKVKTVKQAADELTIGTTNGLREDVRTYSIRANADLYKQLFELWHSTTAKLVLTAGWGSAIAFQPISNSMIRASDEKGGNVLGLDRRSIRLLFTWALAEDDKHVYASIDGLIAASMNIANSGDQLEQYIYLNYANTNQRPIESYGPAQVDFLRLVKAKYDPNGYLIDFLEELFLGQLYLTVADMFMSFSPPPQRI